MVPIGRSPLFTSVVRQAGEFAASALPVLLIGETGTGKEVFARHIDACSGRRGRFVPTHCGAVPRELMESHLFGHRRGAFTGATRDHVGVVKQAEHGTLFLDELLSLPPDGQAKLLRVLDTGEVCRIGDVQPQRIEFRLITAVQTDVYDRLQAGLFRYDLYQRVAGVPLVLPPLRARVEDIELLATHFAALHQRTLAPEVGPLLRRYHWPGNVRELQMIIARAAVRSPGGVITGMVVAAALDEQEARGAERPLATLTRARLLDLCRAHEADPLRIARALGIGRSTLYEWLKRYGIRLRTMPRHSGALAGRSSTVQSRLVLDSPGQNRTFIAGEPVA